jgi:hypothetical protein
MTVIRPPTGGHVHDYMSYGPNPLWTSVGTWEHLYTALVENAPQGDARGSAAAAGPRPASTTETTGPVLVVGGVQTADGVYHLQAPYLGVPGNVVRIEPGAGEEPVTVRLLDGAGASLAQTVTTWTVEATHGGDGGKLFAVELPVLDTTGAISVTVGGREVMRADAAGPAPAIELTSVPAGGGRVAWTATGVTGPFTVEASDDEGQSWWMVGQVDDNELTLDPNLSNLHGPGWRLRVQASDGVRVAAAVADAVDLGSAPPVARIGAPRPGAWVTNGMVDVSSMASSIEEGIETEWSVDGEVVNAGDVSEVPVLTDGEHTIELTVRNEAGSDTASVTVFSSPDVDMDGLADAWEAEVGLDPTTLDDTAADGDDDGLATGSEYGRGTDPTDPDTDGDGYSDGAEVAGAGDPLDPAILPGPVHGVDDATGQAAGADVAGDRGGSDGTVVALGLAAVALLTGAGTVLWRRRHAPQAPPAD